MWSLPLFCPSGPGWNESPFLVHDGQTPRGSNDVPHGLGRHSNSKKVPETSAQGLRRAR